MMQLALIDAGFPVSRQGQTFVELNVRTMSSWFHAGGPNRGCGKPC